MISSPDSETRQKRVEFPDETFQMFKCQAGKCGHSKFVLEILFPCMTVCYKEKYIEVLK